VTGFIPYEEAGGVGPGAVLIAVAFLSLVPGCARSSANTPGGAVTTPREHSIKIDPGDQECTQDTECILIQTHCGGCSCGTPINRAAEAKVQRRFKDLCEGFYGPHCEIHCPERQFRCLEGTCVTR
jgi:hypothetical protein